MTMKTIFKFLVASILVGLLWSCNATKHNVRSESNAMPNSFGDSSDSTSIAKLNWREYFGDDDLIALIDTALRRNQELNILLQEIEIERNEVRARTGEYLPFLSIRAGAGFEKEGRFTRHGAVDESLQIEPGKPFPEPLADVMVGAFASWEVDVWKKLRNAKKAATLRYLASIEGRNFMITNLIAEIASSYYEWIALENLLDIVEKNIDIQTDAMQVVRRQKESAKLTQLAVNRFEAQLLNTKSRQFEIRQQIVEVKNRLHFLSGTFPGPLNRRGSAFNDTLTDSIPVGIPSQLLQNRPDIRQAELQLAAAKLDVKTARANFYPSFSISAGAGFQAFNTAHLTSPESILYNLAGDLMAPLINRNAIKAQYQSASARQLQEVYNYERTVLRAYIDVVNQLAQVENAAKSYEMKSMEVQILTRSIDISNNLFRSARADYLEVLLTQREALESRTELVEIRMRQMNAKVNIYRTLGGGWN